MSDPIHIRVHMVIVGLMLAVIVFLTIIMSQLSSFVGSDVPADPMHSVIIATASFGFNCNPSNSAAPVSGDSEAVVVKENNAQAKLASLCNNKSVCQFNATVSDIGFDPAPHCDKELELSYRCFSYDKSYYLKFKAGDAVTIDCRTHKEP